MKKILSFAVVCMAIISCSKDDVSVEKATTTNKVLNFASYEEMDQKIDEISALKAKMEDDIAQKYISKNTTSENAIPQVIVQESSILANLKKYHTERLVNIYNLREKLNFTSIQSIADEINSLKVLDPDKSSKLFSENEKFLKKNEFNLAVTVFENRTAEVINTTGQVIVNGNDTDFKIPALQSSTGKYIGDESMKTGLAVMSPDGMYRVFFTAGREKHKDDFNRTFFKYYTEFSSYIYHPTAGVNYYPALCSSKTTSYAGYSQSGSNPLADFAFTMRYPFGSGMIVRETGGQKWTAYQPEGGYLDASFVIGAQVPYFSGYIVNCDFKYDSNFLPK